MSRRSAWDANGAAQRHAEGVAKRLGYTIRLYPHDQWGGLCVVSGNGVSGHECGAEPTERAAYDNAVRFMEQHASEAAR